MLHPCLSLGFLGPLCPARAGSMLPPPQAQPEVGLQSPHGQRGLVQMLVMSNKFLSALTHVFSWKLLSHSNTGGMGP